MSFLGFLFNAVIDGFSFRDGLIGFLVALILTGGLALLLAAGAYGIFWVADNAGMDGQTGQAVVIGKEYVPAHTTTTYTTVNNVMIPNIIYHPDAWYVEVERDGLSDSISVIEEFYTQIKSGDPVYITFNYGRFSGGLNVTEIKGF